MPYSANVSQAKPVGFTKALGITTAITKLTTIGTISGLPAANLS